MSQNNLTTQKMSTFLASPNTQEYLIYVLGNKKDSFITNLASITSQDKALATYTNVSVMSVLLWQPLLI